MTRVLAVGIATLDIVNEVDAYPREDSEVRACAQSFRRGGNATNSLVVLSQLGHQCEWAGVWSDGTESGPILEDLEFHDIGVQYCRRVKRGRMPVSCITLNRASGSRTIVHYRALPEYDSRSFSRIPLAGFDWVHFEGRNVDETLAMMQLVRRTAPALPISLEVEKHRAGIEHLFPLADLILFCGLIAVDLGLEPAEFLRQTNVLAPMADLVCSLGEQGATGLESAGNEVYCSASKLPAVIDTIGAGDTFNAGMIDARLCGARLEQAMRFACSLAGNKCAQSGFRGLPVPARDF